MLCLPSLLISLDHWLAPSVLQAIGFTTAQGRQIGFVQRVSLWQNSKKNSAMPLIMFVKHREFLQSINEKLMIIM